MKRIFSFAMLALISLSLFACAEARNQKPVINGAKDITITQGDPFDPLEGITATDPEDGDITKNIQVVGWTASNTTEEAGTYSITYTVSDSKGLAADPVTIVLEIKPRGGGSAKAPVISGVVRNQEFYIGTGDWDPLNGITATDELDGDITDKLQVVEDAESFYDLTFPGKYTIKIRVVNSNNIVANETIILNVLPSPIPTSIPKTEIKIVLWHAMGDANQQLLKKYAQSFHDYYAKPENGGYNFVVEIPDSKGNYDSLKTEMIYAITAGTMPNMVQAYPDHVAEYLAGNAVINLNPYIYNATWGLNGADALDDIIQSYREENSQYDTLGTYYSLPFNKSTEVMIYNKTLLDQLGLDVPETWQDIFEMAPTLNQWAQSNNIQNFVPASYDSLGNAFITFVRQFDGKYTGINYQNFQGQYLWRNDENTTAAMQFLKDNKQFITLPEYWDQQYASTPFVNRQTAITIGSSAGVRYNVPANNLFEIGVAPVPYNADKPESKAVIQQGTNIALLKTGTNEQRFVSWLFLKWLINTENTIDWAMNTGYLPVRESGYNHPTYQSFLNNPTADQKYISMAANAAYLQFDHFYYDPAFIGSSRARTAVGDALERIMLGDGNIAAALEDAYKTASLGQ
ncbi:extracellular solute-binding protein [Acholeplasma equifetale]|uniref:extracellular solute-binding protein n=1 Tax=Acholeplasma equifetale TaxID=264634 RepID=UPI00047BF970|nr:extracellular solute-binding protein [Acholeplasma equifetale]